MLSLTRHSDKHNTHSNGHNQQPAGLVHAATSRVTAGTHKTHSNGHKQQADRIQ